MITIKGIDYKMIANNIEPFASVHPGEMIKEEIECRGISQKKWAEQTIKPTWQTKTYRTLKTMIFFAVCGYNRAKGNK